MQVRAPWLVLCDGPSATRVAVFPPGSVATVGRAAEVELPLDDPAVSRIHATFTRTGAALVIDDPGFARNGTFVNGRRVDRTILLRDGDDIRIGNSALLVRLPRIGDLRTTVALGKRPRRAIHTPLTSAERALLRAIAQPGSGAGNIPTNRELAAARGVDVSTIKTQLVSITNKLRAAGVTGAIDRIRIAELARSGELPGTPD
jgi:pSer/pThr/pTyr-binding forkhead associated (FHA) protein